MANLRSSPSFGRERVFQRSNQARFLADVIRYQTHDIQKALR